MKIQNDPEHYEKMNASYPSPEAAQAAIDAFIADVSEARERHRIGNVVIVAAVRHDNQVMATHGILGDERHVVTLLAYALKRERDQHAAPLKEFDRAIKNFLADEAEDD